MSRNYGIIHIPFITTALNTIIHGDCYDVLKQMPSNSVDLFLQDLPYNTTQNEWEYAVDLQKMWVEWLRVGKENAAFIFTAAQPFTTDLIMSNRKIFKYDLIWYKPLCSGFLNANKMPLRNHESILVFYKSLPTFNPQMEIGLMKKKGGLNRKSSNYGDFAKVSYKTNDTYFPQSVINITNGDRQKENEHPTQKPIDLIRYLIRTYSNEADLVFDGYSGSGTTAAASIVEKRKFICVEKEKGYFDKSINRIAALKMQTSLF